MGLGNGSIDILSGYEKINNCESLARDYYSQAQSLDFPERYSNEKLMLVRAFSDLRTSLSNTKEYLDNPRISILSDANKKANDALDEYQLANKSVTAKATEDGYISSNTAN